MGNARTASALVIVAALLPAQSTPPPTCFGFNMAGGSNYDLLTIPFASPLTIYFTAPQTVTVDQVVTYENHFYGASVNVAVHAINPVTTLPAVPALGTAPGNPFFLGSGWMAKTLTPPISFSSGTQYALVCTPAPTSFVTPLVQGMMGYDPSPTATPLFYTGGSYNAYGTVPAGPTLGFRFGFQGPTCGAKLAEVLPGGPPCGGATANVPLLCAVGGSSLGIERPVLGSQLYLELIPTLTGGNPPMPTALYWSFGSNLAGTPISPSSPCSHHLNPASFASLLALGFEPLATSLFWSGYGNFQIPVPNAPALIGTPVAVQALLIDPAGVPSGVPGVNIRISNSLTLLPGL